MRLDGTEQVFKYLQGQGFALFWGSDFVDITKNINGKINYVGTIYSDGKFKPCEGFPVNEIQNFGLAKVNPKGYNFNR